MIFFVFSPPNKSSSGHLLMKNDIFLLFTAMVLDQQLPTITFQIFSNFFLKS